MTSRVVDVVAGARPNFMKVAPILRALTSSGGTLHGRLVHTGQHYDEGMSEVFFRQLGIPAPAVDLGTGSGSHGAQTARVLEAYERHLLECCPRPCGVVVVGDVNSTLACALAAVKLGVPTAHVEAGLRSFDRAMPEEINRLATDAIVDLLFVSEPQGEVNLLREGVGPERIRYVGNVMIDTLEKELQTARGVDPRTGLGLGDEPYAYVTLHRPATVDHADRLGAHVEMLEGVAGRLPIVFPLHPRTRQSLERFGLFERLRRQPRFRLLDPLGYRENLSLLAAARVVLTDSGGIQEEATHLGIPCLTLRRNTERPATVTMGTNTLVGDELSCVGSLVEDILAGRYKRGRPIRGWDGRAAERIVETLVEAWA